MKIIPTKVWNRIEMLQQPIAAVAPASSSTRKRWAAIIFNNQPIPAYPQHSYCIVDTEFDAALLDKYAEFGDEDLAIVNQAKYYATNADELYELLLKLRVDPESFDAPWHVNHPLL